LNIIYLHSHDTGRYIQPYGHAIPTPHMQRIAEQGVTFRHAFCANPTSSPSRASLLSGSWAHSNGMLGLAHRGWKMSDYSEHVANLLKANGYTCCVTGTQHVIAGGDPDGVRSCGYDVIQADLEGKTPSDKAVQFLRDHVKNNPDKPFFLDCGHGQTHRAGEGFGAQPEGEEKFDARFVKPPAPLPDNATTRQDMAEYIDCARTLDQLHGQVLDELDALGIADNTLVILTTDHGIAFPNMKCALTDHGLGVLLIMRGPQGFDGGKVLDGMVSHIDIVPTICDLLGIAVPDHVQGKSITPLVNGDVDEVNDAIFGEVNYHAAYEPKRCVRTTRYKYIRRYDGRTKRVLPNCDDSMSKTYLREHGWDTHPVAEEALYDLLHDPNEGGNVATHPEALADMRARLDKWMQETDDPILKGPIELVEGGVTNDPDAQSPRDRPDRAK